MSPFLAAACLATCTGRTLRGPERIVRRARVVVRADVSPDSAGGVRANSRISQSRSIASQRRRQAHQACDDVSLNDESHFGPARTTHTHLDGAGSVDESKVHRRHSIPSTAAGIVFAGTVRCSRTFQPCRRRLSRSPSTTRTPVHASQKWRSAAPTSMSTLTKRRLVVASTDTRARP